MPVRPDPLHAAFLACDITGSATLDVAHRALARDLALHHGGWELAFHGDGLLFAFDRSATAARCAVELLRAATPGIVRAGLHTGGALRHDGVVVGRAVHHARRLAEAAAFGEILLSPIAAGDAGAATEPASPSTSTLPGRLPARRLVWDRAAPPRSPRFQRGGGRRAHGAAQATRGITA